jgi:hypothetical protein
MEFSWTRKAIALSVSGLFIALAANILANSETMDTITINSPNIYWASIIGLSIIFMGFFMDVSDFVYDLVKWRKFIDAQQLDKEKPYISSVVSNKTEQQKNFFCILLAIKYNGNRNAEMEQKIIEHTARVSWSGGSKEGMKTIDGKHDGTLNIVSITDGKLAFEMASGTIETNFPNGNYDIDLELNRQSKEGNFRKNKFSVSFDYYVQSDGIAKIHLFKKQNEA